MYFLGSLCCIGRIVLIFKLSEAEMKVGTQKLIYMVEDVLYRNHVTGSRRRIAKEIIQTVMDLIGDDDMNKAWNAAHDFPPDLEKFVRRLETGLKIGYLKRTEKAAEIYRWLIEQEKGGSNLEVFFAWANSEEQVKYISKYFSNPEWLKVDFPRAYSKTKTTLTNNGDGSLYV